MPLALLVFEFNFVALEEHNAVHSQIYMSAGALTPGPHLEQCLTRFLLLSQNKVHAI